MFLLGFEHDCGAGVEPLAILQHVCLGTHISSDHAVITIVPIYLKQSTFYNIVNQDKNAVDTHISSRFAPSTDTLQTDLHILSYLNCITLMSKVSI